MREADLAARFGTELAKAGLEGCLHAVDIDPGTQISFRGEELCTAASTGKVPILVALMRAVAAGDADLSTRRRPVRGRGLHSPGRRESGAS